MTDLAVQFQEIDVRRVQGIDRSQGFTLSGFSSGINLIHGPNGSGKSTTARALHELLWPGRTNLAQVSITGQFRAGQDQWKVDIDAGHPLVTCNGKTGIAPEFGPPENRHRYYISLHELITDDDADFAKAIADASQGGYDLEAAAQALGFRERPSSRKILRQVLQARQGDVEVARHRQQQIEHAAAQLQELRNQRDQAIAADREIATLRSAKEYHQAAEKCRQLELHLGTMAEGISKLRGDERKRLEELSAQRTALESQRANEQERCRRAEETRVEVALPEQGVEPNVLQLLSGWQRGLQGVEADIRQQRNQLREYQGDAATTARRLGTQFSEEQLAKLDRLEIGHLNSFARLVDRVRGEECVIQERHKNLGKAAPEDVQQFDAQRIRDGIKALSRWLSAPNPIEKASRPISWPLLVAAFVIAVLGIVLSVTSHWLWAVSVLLAIGVLAAEWWPRRQHVDDSTMEAQQIHRQSYDVTGLTQPDQWEDSAVMRHLDRLFDMTLQREREDKRIRSAKELDADVATYDQRCRELERQREGLVEHLGVKLELDDQWLPLLVDNIAAWQLASGKAAGAQEALSGLEKDQKDLLTKIDLQLDPYGDDLVDSAETAAQAIEALNDRQSRHRQSMHNLDDAKRRLEGTITPGLEKVDHQHEEILNDLGIQLGQESIIDDWLNEHPEHLRISTELTKTETIRNDREQSLTGRHDLMELSLVEIEQRLADQNSMAQQRDTSSEKIAEIERDIRVAMEGYELSSALEARDSAEAELSEALEENCNMVIGDLVTKLIREEAIQRSRPEVFRLANSLLIKFTRGALELHVDEEGSEPRFLASSPSASGAARSVDELSSGERVQLLMAVRMAFMQYDEQSCLPLLLDEALGTSDDDRIGVIIDSIMEIAREGRQVFYFTAQRDEAGKLITKANEAELPVKVFDLAEHRQLTSAQSTPLEITTIPVAQPPSPDGMDYEQYGHVLNVPGLDPFDDLPNSVHLWHVLVDTEVLYHLLCQNITTWGQLELLIEHGGAQLVNVAGENFDGAAVAAKAIKTASAAWRNGRGRHVDRAALLDSGCVSSNFIDEIVSLAEANSGDAQAIIDALERGEVSRWRKKATEALESYFEENGYLPDIAPLQVNEIQIRVMAAVADDLKNNRINQSTILRIVGSLPLDIAPQSPIC